MHASRFGQRHPPRVEAVLPTGQQLTAVALTGCPALYARVDGVLVNNRFTLMELELIEPDLFLASEAEAAARFARVLAATMLRDSERPNAARDCTL